MYDIIIKGTVCNVTISGGTVSNILISGGTVIF